MANGLIEESKLAVRRALERLGLDVRRAASTPRATLLGLRNLPVRTIIDVGANEGQFATEMRGQFPAAIIHAFEPLAAARERLVAWASRQGTAVKVYPCALGAEAGEATMCVHLDHDASSSLLRSTADCSALYPFTQRQGTEVVRQSTLDAELPRSALTDLVLLKLDVQGYEDRVLAGASVTLDRVHACIIEVNIVSLYQGQATFRAIVDRLDDHRLVFRGLLDQATTPDGSPVYADAVFKRVP